VAIVTGAGRGVGRGEALFLAAAGAKVVVNDLGVTWDGSGEDQRPAQVVADEIVAAGGTAVANYDDVSSWKGAEHMIVSAIEEFGDLDILVNNAGFLRDRTSFNMSEEEWDSVTNVHLKGHFAPTRFATAYWREQAKAGASRRRTIVNTTSGSGLFGAGGQSNYASAKLGIVSMTIAVAKECGKYGVTVNAVAPRARTRMTENTFGDAFASARGTAEFDSLDPDNIAPFVGWLCTDAAADVTGQTFMVWGGVVAHMRMPYAADLVAQDHRWTLEELDARRGELFATVPPDTFEKSPER